MMLWHLKMAFASMNQRDFTASQEDLDHAYAAFETASTHIGRMGRVVTFVSQFIPGASRLASGDHLVRAGAALTHAAKELHGIVPQVMEQGTDLMASDGIRYLLSSTLSGNCRIVLLWHMRMCSQRDHILIVCVLKIFRRSIVRCFACRGPCAACGVLFRTDPRITCCD